VTYRLKLQKMLRDDTGATAIEYALIAAAMGVALVPAMANFSGDINGVYGKILNYFNIVG
jgi:Flp pilus assembly pilin Flp